MNVRIEVNGREIALDVDPLRRLVDILREDLGLVAAKIGCGEGECGSCNVWLDGKVVSACLVPAIQADGRKVTTLEGLFESPDPRLLALRDSFLRHDVSQCGACIPGIVMTCFGLFESASDKPAGAEEVRRSLAGNLCRCTGYAALIDALADWLETEGKA
jgi:aerobic-type carbon monoxide dehydrogenase small subunit (CoxS/CutS family)